MRKPGLIVPLILLTALVLAAAVTDQAAFVAWFLIAVGVVAIVLVLPWQLMRVLFKKPVARWARLAPLLAIGGGVMMLTVCILKSPPALADENLPPGEEIAALFAMDQADRLTLRFLDTNRDDVRRARILDLYGADLITQPQDYYNAGFIMQHGQTSDSYQLAHELATLARDAKVDGADWLFEATYDRWMISLGKPQEYGTQTTINIGGPKADPAPTSP